MINAARKAARAVSRDFGEVENLQVSHKAPADFVTRADRKAEEVIREELVAKRCDRLPDARLPPAFESFT